MENVTFETAQTLLDGVTQPILEIEWIELLSAHGRILAEDMRAGIDNPPFDRSPVDGYACRAEDILTASKESPVELTVVEEIDAGGFSKVTIGAGQAVRIMTGAMIPTGCDCCIRQESTDYGENRVKIYESVKPGTNYCWQGEDFKKGTILVFKGTKLSYIEIGILAGMGCKKVPVYRLPKVALLTTGDEVMTPGEELLPGKIYNSNQFLLVARMAEFGIAPFLLKTVEDDEKKMAEALRDAAQEADIIVTTGGVSVGKKDILHGAASLLGAKRLFWRLLVQPGSPTLGTVYNEVPIVSLSGNPFGAAANFELLLRPMLAKMMQDTSLTLQWKEAVMAEDFSKRSRMRRFIRGKLVDGKVYMPKGLHSSGVLSSMQGCNCMVDIPAGNEGLVSGDAVFVVLI